MMLHDFTEVNPRKRGGIPVLRGSRFTLAQVLAEIAVGRSISEIAEEFDLDLNIIKGFLDGLAVCFDRPVSENLDVQVLRQPQDSKSGVNAIIGKWPGDESDDEFKAMLEEIS